MKLDKSNLFIAALCLFFSGNLLATEYTVAVRAHRGVDEAVNQWYSTVALLNERLPQHHFVLKPIVSLNQITYSAKNKEFDFVLTNPSSFIEVKKLYGADALATLNNKRANTAQDKFGSVIFTHVLNTDILTLEDLHGKSLMAVSEPAFGGWRVAWLEMKNQGLNPYEDLSELKFTRTKTQPPVVDAVLKREVDAGVVRTDQLEQLEANGKVDMRFLRVLNNKDIKSFPFFLSTDLYPEWAFAALKHVPKEVQLEVSNVLYSIVENSSAALNGKYVGWAVPDSYQSVQLLMKRLKVGPYVVK